MTNIVGAEPQTPPYQNVEAIGKCYANNGKAYPPGARFRVTVEEARVLIDLGQARSVGRPAKAADE